MATITPVDFSKLRRDLARAVARVCPSWLADQRDDLVQAAAIRVMQAIERQARHGEGDARFTSSYLYRIAYSVLVDELRRRRRRHETALDDAPVDPPAPAQENPERLAVSSEIGRGILDCLARLKRERRLAVTLHLQGQQVPEIARVLDWSRKRVENLVYRGLADLRACLTAKGVRP